MRPSLDIASSSESAFSSLSLLRILDLEITWVIQVLSSQDPTPDDICKRQISQLGQLPRSGKNHGCVRE